MMFRPVFGNNGGTSAIMDTVHPTENLRSVGHFNAWQSFPMKVARIAPEDLHENFLPFFSGGRDSVSEKCAAEPANPATHLEQESSLVSYWTNFIRLVLSLLSDLVDSFSQMNRTMFFMVEGRFLLDVEKPRSLVAPLTTTGYLKQLGMRIENRMGMAGYFAFGQDDSAPIIPFDFLRSSRDAVNLDQKNIPLSQNISHALLLFLFLFLFPSVSILPIL
jgi:hypothetical protein